MKVVLFAFTNFGYDCVEYIHKQKKYKILVVTSPSDKGEHLNGWRSVLSFCRKKNISFIKTDMHKIGMKVINKVISFSPDIIFSCNYPLIIPPSILHSSKYGGLNFHGGILPYYRGCLSGVWSILNNENESGVTLHYMDENLDTGDIVEIRKVKILPSDTAISLYEKVRILSYELFKAQPLT